jgi:hypothetical protein
MSRYRSTITPGIVFAAATPRTLVRANPRRCCIVIPVPPGVTFAIDMSEPPTMLTSFAFSGLTSPLVIHEDFYGDFVERAISAQSSGAITISVLEVFDMERKV